MQLLERRITSHQHHQSSPSFDSLPISHVSLFDSIDNADVREQLYTQYRQVIEQSGMDILNLYVNSGKTQMQHYQREHTNEIKRVWQVQRSLPLDSKLTDIMMDLLEKRVDVIVERIKCIYNYRAQSLAIHS